MNLLVEEFQRHFFSMTRLPSFPWSSLLEHLQRDTSSQLISEILDQTCRHSLCRKFPPSVRFRRLFLSQLIKQQEEAGADPLDELYDALAEVLGPEDANECYKNYLLGTTGLVTWEAGLYLAEWALDHREVFTGRTVLELGSGMGVTGITVCRCCSPSSLVFSDYNPSVLQKLRTNVGVNGLSNATPVVSVEQLDWTSATEEQLQKIGADVVIAADVTYDPEVARNLVTLVSKVIRSSGPEVFICSTIRNLETHHGFKQHLENAGIKHKVITGGASRVFCYDRTLSLELIQLYR
ncbi:protein-lysine N-methyltransferase EEF2KMT isoform X2 [Cynoglossus semilaevis]|uniref:protein-lysine N-methyltransferase EEF2KMT isoform X2 n=1 Tax=Cynoglossus semilaevis TaxID=244447 RepID=UPI0004953691|nr:protein-lysine N-methyltransferase EEF2KMT isoform X2 [Cynoglossus semilaevis]